MHGSRKKTINKFAANQIDTMHARIQEKIPGGGGGSDCDSSFFGGSDSYFWQFLMLM